MKSIFNPSQAKTLNSSQEKTFNPSQYEAIHHHQGPAMVLAGPGSGKTTVITERVRVLIEEYGVDPSSILVVTFTKAAASEMKERFIRLCGGRALPVSFGTFHSVFFTILKAAYNYSGSDIITDGKRNALFREIIDELDIETDDTADFVSNIAAEVSLVKGEMISPEYYYSVTCSDEIFRSIYHSYNQKLRQRKKIDFDDMLIYTWELFTQRRDILAAWQKKFRYILIDEFQDINRIQYEIIRLLAAPENNLFIVGDDDQSIYRFRGAKPEIMLGFGKDYPNAKQVVLNINYRCTQEIVEGALRVIRNNRTRYEKELKAFKPGGKPIVVKMFNDTKEEYDTIIKDIYNSHQNDKIPLSDMAVLYRTNTGVRPLIARLMEYNVPFSVKDSVPNLFEHWVAGDILAYIRAALGVGGRSAYLRIINRPNRYVSRKFLSESDSLSSLKQKYPTQEWMRERIDILIEDMKKISSMLPFAAINYIRFSIGYDKFLSEYAKDHRIDEDSLIEVAQDVMESAADYKTFNEWFAFIDDYGQKLEAQKKSAAEKMKEAIVLSTMHSAKGLEYEKVFIIDVNEGIIPHKKAVLEEDLEEERRMFYVAMTRAKFELHVYFAKNRFQKPAVMSPFVGEILTDRSMFQKGAIVSHKVYGEGRVIETTQTTIKVLFFKTKEIKTMSLSFCIANGILTAVKRDKE